MDSLFGKMVNASQNVLFVGEAPTEADLNQPAGAGVASSICSSLHVRGFSPSPIEDWRDSGWSIRLSTNKAVFEIALAQTIEPNLWMLQIACANEPSLLARMFGKRSLDHSKDILRISCAVHETLVENGYTEIRWCLNGFPNENNSTSVPMPPHEKAK